MKSPNSVGSTGSQQSSKKWSVRDYLGFLTATLTIVSLFLPKEKVGPILKILSVCGLAIISLIFLKNQIVRLISRSVVWSFRTFLGCVEVEVKEFLIKLRAEKTVHYTLEGTALKKEGYQHISMRIETIQTIFDAIPSAQDAQGLNYLKEIGRNVGQNFVRTTWKQMREHWRQNAGIAQSESSSTYPMTESEIRECLKMWCQMEGTAGWGHFDIPEFTITDERFVGTLRIRDCFLTVGRMEESPKLCSFLEGYCETILSGLLNRRIAVTELQCGQRFPVDKICIFRIEAQRDKKATD